MPRGAIVSITHGGGPLPLMNDPRDRELVNSLKVKVPKILRLGTPEAPRAIIVVSAHWTETVPTISSAPKHKLYYDYYNFPPETYNLTYDAPGEPEVAKEIFDALSQAGLEPKMDAERGWDHGVFVPMLLINPKADIPIVSLSVLTSEDPATHYAMGLALKSLRDSNIAIIGSGSASSHNMPLQFSGKYDAATYKQKSVEFSEAVTKAVTTRDEVERGRLFEGWRGWPSGREIHPERTGDHFMPLVVCAGAAGPDVAAEWYEDELMGLGMVSYHWT